MIKVCIYDFRLSCLTVYTKSRLKTDEEADDYYFRLIISIYDVQQVYTIGLRYYDA